MIDLTQSVTASPLVHTVARDPGISWASRSIAIDAPPDSDLDPSPDAQWSAEAVRSGLCGAVSPRVVALPDGGYRMYYAGYGEPTRADILTAVSDDGLDWQKAAQPVLTPGSATWDAVKRSEMCVIWNPQVRDSAECFRMFYEACDGTAEDQRGVWRIASENCIS